jgi:hypothetical protein
MIRNFEAIAALLLLSCGACTHNVKVTPTYSPHVLAARSPGRICPHGEAILVTAVNQSQAGQSAGTTEAGIHTFNYRFDSDPSLILKYGLEEALRQGGCGRGPSGVATLRIALASIEARGLECGFISCEGKGESMVEVTLLDEAGRALLTDTFRSSATSDCGLAICNGKEASTLANEVLSDAIGDTIAGFAAAIKKKLAERAAPAAPAPTPDPAAPATEPASPPS